MQNRMQNEVQRNEKAVAWILVALVAGSAVGIPLSLWLAGDVSLLEKLIIGIMTPSVLIWAGVLLLAIVTETRKAARRVTLLTKRIALRKQRGLTPTTFAFD